MEARMTPNTLLLLRALMSEPGRELYGFEVMRATGLPSGTVYPLLTRLEAAGWLAVRDEGTDPKAEGRPARRYYRITDAGRGAVGAEMDRLAEALAALGALGITPVPMTPGDENSVLLVSRGGVRHGQEAVPA
jgi:DNA-binding MarR family transcriptional regulator